MNYSKVRKRNANTLQKKISGCSHMKSYLELSTFTQEASYTETSKL